MVTWCQINVTSDPFKVIYDLNICDQLSHEIASDLFSLSNILDETKYKIVELHYFFHDEKKRHIVSGFCFPGADIIGVNCFYDPIQSISTMKEMKAGLAREGLDPFLMMQPNGFLTPEATACGWFTVPEFPLGQLIGTLIALYSVQLLLYHCSIFFRTSVLNVTFRSHDRPEANQFLQLESLVCFFLI